MKRACLTAGAAVFALMGVVGVAATAAFAQPQPSTQPATAPAPVKAIIAGLSHTVDFHSAGVESLTLKLQIPANPSLKNGIVSLPQISEAIDDSGASLVVAPSPDATSSQVVSGNMINLDIPLQLSGTRKTLKHLAGEVTVTVAHVDKILIAVPGTLDRTWGSVHVTCRTRLSGSSCLLDFVFQPKPGSTDDDAYKAMMAKINLNLLTIKDTTGVAWRSGGNNGGARNGPQLAISYVFNAPTPPAPPVIASFEVLLAEPTQTTIPFKVDNIPLP